MAVFCSQSNFRHLRQPFTFWIVSWRKLDHSSRRTGSLLCWTDGAKEKDIQGLNSYRSWELIKDQNSLLFNKTFTWSSDRQIRPSCLLILIKCQESFCISLKSVLDVKCFRSWCFRLDVKWRNKGYRLDWHRIKCHFLTLSMCATIFVSFSTFLLPILNVLNAV